MEFGVVSVNVMASLRGQQTTSVVVPAGYLLSSVTELYGGCALADGLGVTWL